MRRCFSPPRAPRCFTIGVSRARRYQVFRARSQSQDKLANQITAPHESKCVELPGPGAVERFDQPADISNIRGIEFRIYGQR
jgi:hypothetical protein